jgi:hypothetical protein
MNSINIFNFNKQLPCIMSTAIVKCQVIWDGGNSYHKLITNSYTHIVTMVVELYCKLVEKSSIKCMFHYSPSVPNYLSVLIETQILRNLLGICKNTQLQSNLSLNKLSNELICTQNGIVN